MRINGKKKKKTIVFFVFFFEDKNKKNLILHFKQQKKTIVNKTQKKKKKKNLGVRYFFQLLMSPIVISKSTISLINMMFTMASIFIYLFFLLNYMAYN